MPYVADVPDAFDPFTAQGPEEVPLPRSPLIRVIAQLRFPPIVSLGQSEFVGPFQEEIRPRYPVLRPEETAGIVVGPGIVHAGSGIVWRFHDKSDTWRVSLAREFVALESLAYKDRDDFFERLEEILVALEKLAKLTVYDRLGVRYVNRVHPPELDRLDSLVRPEVLGVAAQAVAGLRFSLCESQFGQDDVTLNTRWARLPAGATTDPSTIDPIDTPSWVLDLDVFRMAQRDFDTASVLADGRAFARTIHDFFRWCVMPEFLKAYGGNP
ncbi:MAG: hypothetical protein CMLOHMNK_03630 [Steroidobacteraceae bacterium]|nr:hypothetical protein [Steroidobacteraceae bacterium]